MTPRSVIGTWQRRSGFLKIEGLDKKNPPGFCFYCDLTSRDLPDASFPLFVLFCNPLKGTGGLVIDRHAALGTLESSCVEERGGYLGNFRRDL